MYTGSRVRFPDGSQVTQYQNIIQRHWFTCEDDKEEVLWRPHQSGQRGEIGHAYTTPTQQQQQQQSTLKG